MTTGPNEIQGHCACGAVAFALTPPTEFVSHCHCATCRRVHGAPFVTWTAVVPAAYHLRAGADVLRGFASSPGVTRRFCGRCGSPVAYVAEGVDKVYVPAALLDRLDRAPDSHVSFEERAPWLEGVEALPCFVAKTEQRTAWNAPWAVDPEAPAERPASEPWTDDAAPDRFSPWRPLDADALGDVVEAVAVVQVKVQGPLLAYPRGQSAMLWYGATPRDAAELAEVASHGADEVAGALVWRALPARDAEGRLARLLGAFEARFGAPPRLNLRP